MNFELTVPASMSSNSSLCTSMKDELNEDSDYEFDEAAFQKLKSCWMETKIKVVDEAFFLGDELNKDFDDAAFKNLKSCWLEMKKMTELEEIQNGSLNLIGYLGELEKEFVESKLARDALAVETEKYVKKEAEMAEKIEKTQKMNARRKRRLERLQRNNAKYIEENLMREMCKKYPPRKLLQNELRRRNRDIKYLHGAVQKMHNIYNERVKQLHLLSTAAQDMKTVLRSGLEEWEDSESD